MEYLKCTDCGCMNEVKTECPMFCSSCGKELEINFGNWDVKNQKSFLEFKKEVFISNENSEADEMKKTDLELSSRNRIRQNVIASLIILSVLMLSLIVMYCAVYSIRGSELGAIGNAFLIVLSGGVISLSIVFVSIQTFIAERDMKYLIKLNVRSLIIIAIISFVIANI